MKSKQKEKREKNWHTIQADDKGVAGHAEIGHIPHSS